MDPTHEDALDIIGRAESKGLLKPLLHQLRKDYDRANVSFPIPESGQSDIPPAQVVRSLHESLYYLLMERFDAYLNLMYAADVPEQEFKNIRPTDAVEVAGEVTYVLLKRELKKVELRSRYDQK
jgi:hypothetical protein